MKQAALDGRRPKEARKIMSGPSCEDKRKMEAKDSRAVHRVREVKSQLGIS